MMPLIAANWKMHKLPSEAGPWAESLLTALSQAPHDHARIAICAPYSHLYPLREVLKGSAITLGAQDVSAHTQGAFTGEISADMLRDLAVTYVIVGHSERRALHQESDARINQKVAQVLAQGLTPILCIGEVLEQREAGQADEVTLSQLRAALTGITLKHAEQLVIAYEPVWAIGTGKTATAADAEEMCASIRAELRNLYPDLASQIYVLYGGSMKPGNAAELLAQPDVNGGLVGGASLEVDSLTALITAARGVGA